MGGTGLDLLLDDAAVEDVDGALGVAREARVVRDHDDGGAGAVERVEQLHHGVAVLGIEVTRGLVGEEDGRGAGEGAGDGDALLLTAGELGGQVLGAVAHADLLEGLGHALLALAGGHAAVGEGQLDVLIDREVADEVEGLENEADLAVADAGALGERQALDGAAVEDVGAVGRGVEEAEDGKEGGLAATGRAGDGDILALADVHVDAGQGVRLDLVGEEDLGHAVEFDQGGIISGHGSVGRWGRIVGY